MRAGLAEESQRTALSTNHRRVVCGHTEPASHCQAVPCQLAPLTKGTVDY